MRWCVHSCCFDVFQGFWVVTRAWRMRRCVRLCSFDLFEGLGFVVALGFGSCQVPTSGAARPFVQGLGY
jgi:hypothetical protein